MIKKTLKHNALLLGFCATTVFSQITNACDPEDCYVVIEPPHFGDIACGAGEQVFPYKVVDRTGKGIPIESWTIFINSGDSFHYSDALVSVRPPFDPKDCREGERINGSCIVNVVVNTHKLPSNSCRETLRKRIDRTLYLDLESAQQSAYAPIHTVITRIGSLKDWTYLGPSVVNNSNALAQANKDVGQTVNGGVISENIMLGPTAHFYYYYEEITKNAVANLNAAFTTFLSYYQLAQELHTNKLGDGFTPDEGIHSINAGYYKFNRNHWPVIIAGTFTIKGGFFNEAVFVLDFDRVEHRTNIILSILENAEIKLEGINENNKIRPENVTFLLNYGSMETDGGCDLVGNYYINGGFEDEPNNGGFGCLINGSIFVKEGPDHNPADPEAANVNLFATTGSTP